MQRLVVKKENDIDWSKQFMDPTNYDRLFTDSVVATKPDGSILMILLKNVIDVETNALAWSVLRGYSPGKNGMRATAAGTEMVAKKRVDGSISKQNAVAKGWEVQSGIMGFYERTVRAPYCHKCAWNEKHPDKFERILPLVKMVSDLYRAHARERWDYQKSVAEKTHNDYLIKDSVFTTLTINKNFRTSAHKDAGDLPGALSCMTVFRQGTYKGANLVFPNYRIAADVQMGDLIIFEPHEFHGNTQLVTLGKGSQRCSVVYYYREMMQYCGSLDSEISFAKNRKMGDALYPEAK